MSSLVAEKHGNKPDKEILKFGFNNPKMIVLCYNSAGEVKVSFAFINCFCFCILLGQ